MADEKQNNAKQDAENVNSAQQVQQNYEKTMSDITKTYLEFPSKQNVACSLSLNNIFIQLHQKALSEAQKSAKDLTIQNSAIEGEGNSAKFYGAGSHIIGAISSKEPISRKDALQPIKDYIHWFISPSAAEEITEDKLQPIESNETSTKTKAATDTKTTDTKTDNKSQTNVSSSKIYVPSFSQYLISEDNEQASDDSKIDDKNGEKQDETSVKKNDVEIDKGEESDGPSSFESQTAKGWYAVYQLDVNGQKGKPIADALKKFGSDLLKSFGLKFSHGDGTSFTISGKDIADTFDKVDADKFVPAYQDEIKKKFPQSHDYTVSLFDRNTIIQHCKKWLSSADKSNIKSADWSICTKIDKRDKSYKLYNKQSIADAMTAAIAKLGIIKAAKYKVKADQIILINNYADNVKDKQDKQYKDADYSDAVADSIIINNTKNIIVEDSDPSPKELDQVKAKFDEAIKVIDQKYHPIYSIDTIDNVFNTSLSAINEPDLKKELNGHKKQSPYVFVIRTTEPNNKSDNKNKQINSSQITTISILDLLFESKFSKNSGIIELVKKAFKTFFQSCTEFMPSDKAENPDFSQIEKLDGGYISDDVKNESLMSQMTNIMSQLFENDILIVEDKVADFIEQNGLANNRRKALSDTNIAKLKTILKSNAETAKERIKKYFDTKKKQKTDKSTTKNATVDVYYAISDVNQILAKTHTTKDIDRTENDFYIVPMPGLKKE